MRITAELAIEGIVIACNEATGRHVAITLPRKPDPGSNRVRLAGADSPKGDVVGVNTEGNTVALFKPGEVIKWLISRGLA